MAALVRTPQTLVCLKNHLEGLLQHRFLSPTPEILTQWARTWESEFLTSSWMMLPVRGPHFECLWWIIPYLIINMANGARIIRSGQTSKTCSISARWCHTFEYLSPGSPPPWSLSPLFSDGASRSSHGNWDAQQLAANSDHWEIRGRRGEGVVLL